MFAYRLDDRSELRLLQPHHAPELFRVTDANRAHLRAWLPWVDDVRAERDSAEFIRSALRDFAESGTFVCGIWHDDALCGTVGYNAIAWGDGSAVLGYWLAATHTGRGLMTRACGAMVRHAFDDYRLHRVAVHVATGNARSQAVAERLGFRVEGVHREAAMVHDRFVDLTVNALLAEEWRAGRNAP